MKLVVIPVVRAPTHRPLDFSAGDNAMSMKHKWTTFIVIVRINRERVDLIVKAEFLCFLATFIEVACG